jgi:Na+-transporting NADH:ubiquinone oxidoreductase subunit A
MDRDGVVAVLKRGGLWPLLRQRPLGKVITQTARVPVAIYVNGMDTEPLACDPALAVRGHGEDFQLGIEVLRRLTSGKVYLTVREGAAHPREFLDAKGAEVHAFAGPHPAGLVGTHIRAIQPLKTGESAYYLKAQEAAEIGYFARTGRPATHRVVAAVGPGAPQRKHFRVRRLAAAMTLTGGKPVGPEMRVVSGTVLTGRAIPADGFLGFYAHTLTILPEGKGKRDLLGWARPQVGEHSASRAVFSWLAPKRAYALDARLKGGERAIVNIGTWDDMTPLDVLPAFLVRAVKANDLEEAIKLGLLELTEEDVALCTYADPCKIEVGAVIRKGLDMYEAEGGT